MNIGDDIKACVQRLVVGPGFSQSYDAAVRRAYGHYKPSGLKIKARFECEKAYKQKVKATFAEPPKAVVPPQEVLLPKEIFSRASHLHRTETDEMEVDPGSNAN